MIREHSEAERRVRTDLMASAIVNCMEEKNSCADIDLRAAGFTDSEIAAYGKMAQALAAVRLTPPVH